MFGFGGIDPKNRSVCPKGGACCPQRAVRVSRSHAEEVPTKHTNHTKFRREIAPEDPAQLPLPIGALILVGWFDSKILFSCDSRVSWATPIASTRLRLRSIAIGSKPRGGTTRSTRGKFKLIHYPKTSGDRSRCLSASVVTKSGG